MGYIVVAVVGALAVVLGVLLGVLGYTAGAWIVGAAGGLMTAAGLAGFGLDRRRPSSRLEDIDAAEQLHAREQAEREREAQEAAQGEVNELRLARLRDLVRIRRAIVLELTKVQPGVSLTYGWGGSNDYGEMRWYSMPQDGALTIGVQTGGNRSGWSWPEGELPNAPGGGLSPDDPTHVEQPYKLFQPERYLVRVYLPADDQLELDDPGYGRFGVG